MPGEHMGVSVKCQGGMQGNDKGIYGSGCKVRGEFR